MRIGMIMVKHPPERKSPVFPEVIRLLAEQGAEVDVIHPDEQATELGGIKPGHDLYVLKSGTETALSLAGALHSMGAAILNPYPVSAGMRDKVIATRVLRNAGVPVPETFIAGRPEQLEQALSSGPLIFKPYRGSQGLGISVVFEQAGLAESARDAGLVFAQRYHEPEGEDYKIYSIGSRFFCVRRPWPARSYEDKLGKPFTVSSELGDIASRSGRAFGVELFGIDVVRSNGRYYVVDISSFPGFKGVPGAAPLLADYITTVCKRVVAGGPVAAGR